jgi:MFS family permease
MVSAVSLARRPSIRGLAKWIGIAAVLAGLAAIGFSFSRTVWASAVLMGLAGFGMFMTGAASNTIIQSIIDEDKRSRVMSYFTMFFIGSGPIGHFLAGWLAEAVGAPATFLACGAVAMAAGIVFLAQMRTFRDHLRPVYIKRGIIPADPGPPTQ